jgi:AcrR family transcriptional regulator
MGDSSGKLKDRSGVSGILAVSSEPGRGGKGSMQQLGVRSTMETAKTMQPPRRRDADKAAAILEGALQEFMAYGYAAASMDRIASAGKVSKPTLYTYFQDKEGLFTALILDLMKDEDSPFLNADSATLAQPPEVFLKGLASRILGDLSGEQPRFTLFRLLMGESGRFPELAKAFVKNVEKPILDRLEGYFTQHPELNCPAPQVAARIFMGTIVHYILLQEVLHGKEFLHLEREHLIDGLIELITAKRSHSV